MIELEKMMPPIVLLRRSGKRYMVTMFNRKASCVEVSVTDSAGFQYWRQLWEPYGRQHAGKTINELIAFAEKALPSHVQ